MTAIQSTSGIGSTTLFSSSKIKHSERVCEMDRSLRHQSPKAFRFAPIEPSARHDQNNVSIDWPAARTEQDFHEVRLSLAQLFAGQVGGLRAVARGEKEFAVFQTQG